MVACDFPFDQVQPMRAYVLTTIMQHSLYTFMFYFNISMVTKEVIEKEFLIRDQVVNRFHVVTA